MIENVSTQLTVFHCFAHCLLPGRAFASLYALLFLEKEAEIGGRVCELRFNSPDLVSIVLYNAVSAYNCSTIFISFYIAVNFSAPSNVLIWQLCYNQNTIDKRRISYCATEPDDVSTRWSHLNKPLPNRSIFL